MRTLRRDTFNTRAISRVDTPFALNSRIVVRCAWLNMLYFLLLSDSRRQPVEFPARACDVALHLFLLRALHLRHSFRQPPAGTAQDGNGHLQIALEFPRGGLGGRRTPLRFEEQFGLGEDALANDARAIAPGAIQVPGLPHVATVFNENAGHLLTVVQVDSRYRHQILHSKLRRDLSFADFLLDGFRQKLYQSYSP